MSSLMSSHGGVALVTAMAAGTVILFALRRHKPLSSNISSLDVKKRDPVENENNKEKKRKRVRFAENVVVEFETTAAVATSTEEEEEIVIAEKAAPAMPANRLALYNGIMQYRMQRMACCSY